MGYIAIIYRQGNSDDKTLRNRYKGKPDHPHNDSSWAELFCRVFLCGIWNYDKADQQIDPYELADRINDSCSVKEFRELQEYANELLYIIQKNPEAYREYEKRRLVKEILKWVIHH